MSIESPLTSKEAASSANMAELSGGSSIDNLRGVCDLRTEVIVRASSALALPLRDDWDD